jgi:hypothetical protein
MGEAYYYFSDVFGDLRPSTMQISGLHLVVSGSFYRYFRD